MNLKNLLSLALVLMFSCNNAPISGKGLSTLGFYSTPGTIISTLKAAQKGPHEHFLLGLAYKQEKKYKESILHFANSCFAAHRNSKLRLFPQPVYVFTKSFHLKSDYYDDAVYEIANLFLLYGEHEYVSKFIDLMSGGRTVLCRDARLLKARSLAVLKKYDEAREVLDGLLRRYTDRGSQGLIWLRIGSLMEKKGDYAEALNSYIKVFLTNVKGWQSSAAAEELTGLMHKNPLKLNFDENFLFAKALYYSKKYREAAQILTTLKSENKKQSEVVEFLVRALARDKASGQTDILIKEFTGDRKLHLSLLKAHAEELWSMGAKNKALPLYRRIIETGEEPHAQESLRRVALFMEENKRPGYEQDLLQYKNKYSDDHAGRFLWLLARNMIRARNSRRALQYLEESVLKYPAGSYSDECRFWLHRIYSDTGDRGKADATAREMTSVNPDSPYTWLLAKKLADRHTEAELNAEYAEALNDTKSEDANFYHLLLFIKEKSMTKRSGRIAGLDSPLAGRYQDLENAIADMKTSSGHMGILKAIEKYFIVGHSAAITRELKLLPRGREARKDKYIALAHYSRKFNYTYLEVFSCLKLLKLLGLRENIALMPKNTVLTLFPRPFSDCVSKYGEEYGVEENLIYAVIKAESLFKNSAMSTAGASGLMQLMPATAKGIARRLKLEGYDLTDPCTSIQLGTNYISGLARQFNNNFQYMVAAYNAGSGNVSKWKERMQGDDMDYFTEFTPFIETRYYILRTDKFLTQYTIIYDAPKPER
ncbi:MAG: transglycosylase SLT domain-containing protein [Spirochaetes bacterium]|nr:transglycosylase SLT domain-containing protein [Spirochaetota bacterium]